MSRAAVQLNRSGRLWRLPPGGQRNGLEDQARAPVLQISEQTLPQVLDASRDAGVPGASAYGRAEDALLAVMPRLAREAARCRDTAWR